MSAPSKSDRTTLAAESLERAVSRTGEFGEALARDFPGLSRHDVLAVLRELKRKLSPPGHRGRRQTRQITRAHRDWLEGMRGIALFQKHIPRWDKLGYYARQIKSQRLMAAIRARHRPEKRARTNSEAVTRTNAPA